MSISLSTAQVQRLRTAGVAQSIIRDYQLGRLSPITGTANHIRNLLQGVPSAQSPVSLSSLGSASARSYQPSKPVVNSSNYGYGMQDLSNAPRLAVGSVLPPDSGTRAPLPSWGSAGSGTASGSRVAPVTYKGPNDPGVFGPGISNTNKIVYTDAEQAANDAALDNRTPGRQAEIDQNTINNQPAPVPPSAPVYAPLNIPDIVMRDFLDKAKQQYAAAYAPLYQALDLGKANAQGQQTRSDAVIAGLYKGLANETQASGATQAAQYKQSGNAAQAQAQALQGKIGDIYNGSNSDEAALARSLGQESAAGSLITNNATERQFQQGEAAKQGAAQQASYTQGGQAAQDYATQMAGAARTEGAGRRSDLVAQLADVLSNYDQQRLGYKSQEATGAIQQSNQLSQQDLNQQQNRVQTLLSEAGINDNRTNATYGAQRTAYQDQIDARNAELQRLSGIQTADAARLQNEIDNNFKARQIALDERIAANKGVSLNAYGDPVTGGGTSGTQGGTPTKPDSNTAVTQQAQAAQQHYAPNDTNPPEAYSALIHGLKYGDPNDPFRATAALGGRPDPASPDTQPRYDKESFVNEAVKQAQIKGLNPDVAAAAAATFFDQYGIQ